MIGPSITGIGPIFDMIPSLVILAYIPFLCYRDIKSRTIPWQWWLPLIAVCIPDLYLYLSGSTISNWYFFGISIMFCGVLLCMALLKIIGGADFIFASIIAFFIQTNPFHYPRVFFVYEFMVWLCVIAVFIPIVVWVYNRKMKHRYGVIDMFRKIDGHFPWMLVISLAFIVAMVVDVV